MLSNFAFCEVEHNKEMENSFRSIQAQLISSAPGESSELAKREEKIIPFSGLGAFLNYAFFLEKFGVLKIERWSSLGGLKRSKKIIILKGIENREEKKFTQSKDSPHPI